MAKKIIITGTDLLHSTTDPWGGVNDTQEPITVYNQTVPPGYEWGVNRGEVERFMKAEYGTKFGDFRTTDPDAQNFVHLYGFATVADATLYDTDPERYGPGGEECKVIKDLTIPISTASVDSYIGTLSTSRSTATQYLVKDGDGFEIPVRFNAKHIIAATSQQEPMSGNGTLIIERSLNGTNWTQVGTQTIASRSEDTGFPDTVNLEGLLIEGQSQQIRLRVLFGYTDTEGVAKTLASSPIVFSITSVSLAIEMTTAWQEPQIDPAALSLAYTVRGTVARVLHLKVTGSAGTYETTSNLTAAQTTASFSLSEMSAYGLLTHGIKTCEAWLTAGNETAGAIESDHLVVRIMVVRTNTEGYLEPKLLVSEMKSEVENFVQTRLLAYAVYSPVLNSEGEVTNAGPAIPTTFILTNSASSVISTQQTTYATALVVPQPGTKYYLDMTVEIEQEGDTLASYLHATRMVNGTVRDFLAESIGTGYIYLRVDNSGGFQPTSGSTFLLNPKQRNNNEANPMTILNARNNNVEIPSTWTNFRLGNEDGYIKDEQGESCLVIPAGRTLNIAYNPLALLYRSPNSSLTMEFDVAIRNITNEDDPIIQLAEQISGNWRGLRMLPMTGYFTTESWNSPEESDFRWQEDERVHIAVNIVNAVYPNAHNDALVTPEKQAQSQGSMSLVRIFINGNINRELVYTPSTTEFCTGAMSNGGFNLGQSGADLYIYGIRIWESKALTSEEVNNDRISTLPSSEDKRRLKAENNIIDPNTGLIGLDYITGNGNVKGIRKNYLIYHGNEPYHEDAHKNETGWLEWGRYDKDGNYLPEYSGTLCAASKSLPQKAQGTTAKTYYYHNIQWKSDKITDTITIPIADLHSSITATWDGDYVWKDGEGQPTGETGAWMLKGGCLGKNFPLPTESAQPYHGTTTEVTVPDGWIDGNGKYRGTGVQIAPNIPMAQKTVNKINYASSMQSHLIGINWLYNELHTAICGENTMQQDVQGAVVAKHTEPFLFFTQAEGSNRAVFRGPCAWGAGKMDKPSWGYVKSAHPDFCMIEGADNDKQLTDMRVPWDDEAHGDDPAKVYYDPDNEAFYYRIAGGAEKCIDFDGGKTTEIDGAEYPVAKIVGYIKAAWNFLYLHAPRIRHYNGTYAEFLVDADWAMRPITADTTPEERARIEEARSRVNTANKYWCHAEGSSSPGDYMLKRYDFADAEWVDAGLWDGEAYEPIDLRTYSMTAAAWETLTEAEKGQPAVVNKAFVDAVVADARANIGNYFKVSSLKFHYCFQNHFIAGTDNCSKNTYYVLDPATHLFEMHQDDVDTTLATDNSGLQSKPYYIDRMHPYGGANAKKVAMTADVDNDSILYEGYYNVLFDLCELMWEGTLELQTMMRTIFTQMASLVGGVGSAESATMSGVWRALNRYIFDIQRYFPATVYNEAARIRYELPELIGFLSDIRSIHPIKQSLGDQLQAELQFMKRRLVYMASYAAFGEFTPTGLRNGLTGLAEATDSFGMQKFALPGSSNPSAYVFHLVPHQWIYPTGGRETNNLIDNHVRVAPGDEYVLDINPGQASDLGINVFGLNYYRELGNVGDMVANNGVSNFTLNGRRLTKFICVPTVFYTDEQLPAFRVNAIIIGTATRLKEFNVKGAVIGTGTLNLSNLTLCESIDARDTKISQIRVPEASTIESLQLPATITSLSLTAQPYLSTLTMQGYDVLTELTVTGSPLLGASLRSHVLSMTDADTTVTLLRLHGISWSSQPVEASVVRWLIEVGDRGVCDLTGSMAVVSGIDGRLYYADVKKLIERYGDIRDTENTLYINFSGTSIATTSMSIEGKKYINTDSSSAGYDLDTDDNFNDLDLSVATGNDVAVAYKADGSPTPDVVWELTDTDASDYAEFQDPYSPVLHLKQKGAAVKNIILNVRVTLTNTSGETRQVAKVIGLWNRIPEIGDYAWTDGQFDNTNDASKQLAGIVVRKEEISTGVFRLDILGAADTSFPTSLVADGSESTWGMYPHATNGLPDSKTGVNYNDPVIEAVRVALQNWTVPEGVDYAATSTFKTDVFDTPLINYSTEVVLRKDDDAVAAAGSGIAMQDVNTEDGWKVQTAAWLKNFVTDEENAVLMSYANTILKAVIDALAISQEELPEGCTSEGIPTTTTALYNLAELIVSKAQEAGADRPANYRQLLFMGVRRCNVWCPADIAGSNIVEAKLHPNYARGNWKLPNSALLARIFNFLGNSRAGYNTNGAPNIAYAEQSEGGQAPNVALEAQKPIFANAIARGRSVPVSSGSYHWSSSEGNRTGGRGQNFSNGPAYSNGKTNGFVIRAVTAFTFEA